MSKLIHSLEQLFLSKSNINDVSAKLGRHAYTEMKQWASSANLDDYESIQMNWNESLDFANNKFVKKYKNKPYELNMSAGQNYPKYYIGEGVERYNVDDWRSHDAQQTQEVFRTNDNFRYGNKFKKWETSLYKRHYDRDEHEHGLRDTRELDTLVRGYRMDKIYGPNDYESSDSIMYKI